RRRTFFRAFLRAMTDPVTFDVRSNPSVWLGALLAVPIPLLLGFAHAPHWLSLLSFTAPVGWALVLGAAGRVATIEREEGIRLAEEARVSREREKAAETRSDELVAQRDAMTADLRLAAAVQMTMVPPDIVRADV